jgi:hypothetical protein
VLRSTNNVRSLSDSRTFTEAPAFSKDSGPVDPVGPVRAL